MSSFNFFALFMSVASQDLRALEEFVEEISTDLITKQKKLEDAFHAAQAKAKDTDESSEIHSALEDDANRYFKTFPVYTYSPILLSLYGLFENWLKEVCDHDKQRGFSKINISDLAGSNYIEKSKKYLSLVVEIDLSPVDSLWNKIVFYQNIRNYIAHNNSKLTKINSVNIKGHNLFSQLKNDPSISIDESNGSFYIKDKEFILEAISVVHDYLAFVTTTLSKNKVIAKNTSMPYDNTGWGQEKSENLLRDIIRGLKLISDHESRADKFKDDDLRHNLKGILGSMTYDVTKLYAFFCDGEWQPNHRELIINEKEKGLKILATIYKGH